MLFLHALTALHPGSGTALGTVDLPVQRERHTQWPTIPGSALKGILRDACREKAKERYQDDGEDVPKEKRRTRRQKANEEDDLLVSTFGPARVDEGTGQAGALSVTDARILAFPVRSLRGIFAWVTCPAVLQRFTRDLELIGGQDDQRAKIPQPGETECVLPAVAPKGRHTLLTDDNKLVLEEHDFTPQKEELPAAVVSLVTQAVGDGWTQNQLRERLVLLDNDYFTHFVRHATEVVARIALDYERKAVKGTALFYQEFLPAETLFYAVVLAHDSRTPSGEPKARKVLEYVQQRAQEAKVLQVGGDETTGKGVCAVQIAKGKGSGQ
jgi:CRISPR-associated protein Cmr4